MSRADDITHQVFQQSGAWGHAIWSLQSDVEDLGINVNGTLAVVRVWCLFCQFTTVGQKVSVAAGGIQEKAQEGPGPFDELCY